MNKDNKIKWIIILMLIENYSFPIVLISILLGNNFYSNLIWALYVVVTGLRRSLSDRDNSCGVALLLGGILSLFYLVNTCICPELTSFEVFKDINLFADSLIFVAIIKLFTKMVTFRNNS